ncbi:Acetyltransferase involved in cellulose biosynthesis, CelD/BcsL family [Rhizobium sp. NFR07]|uniref:GNAT family N-acetyltransferase n=1 Tax=Rhizobium sp. NFR07 TaxID=1566262 RepID=UPI0008EFFD23|nr:GNAT family N-acetyltransferase [Rhizobium sp. NFR07]SFB37498.1 Acetyltransferase involved in cellulose biosynthesis, CelD/BcsL family [Rhizobium sp. NFR07]
MSGAIDEAALHFWRFTTLAEIDAIAAAWRDLEARCGDRLAYFQTFDWCRGWIAAFADMPQAPRFRIKTVWRGDMLTAVWPLMIQTNGGIRVLQNLGAPHSQYCNLLYDDAHMSDETTHELLARIMQEPDCDVALFYPVPEHSPLIPLFAAKPPIPGYGGESAVLDLTQFSGSEDYRSQGGKLKKRNRNRRRNHLARGGELNFEVIWPCDSRFADLVRECAAMKRTWLRETGRTSSGFSFAGFEAFLATLTGDPVTLNGACLSVLAVGGKPVAMELGFLRSGHYYAYLGAFDWALRNLSPGKVQMEMTVCWLIDNGADSYDLLGGDGDYKQSWTNKVVPLQGYSLPFSWKGRLYAGAWLSIIRPLAKRIYFAMPLGLRKLAPGMQTVGLVALGI